METSDDALVERYRAGDASAFAELVRRHQRPIYFFALRMTGRPEDAADLTQRTFLRAHQALDRFEGRASLRSWLFQIAANLCRNHHRDTHRVQVAELDADRLPVAPRAQAALERREAQDQLRVAVEGLPPRQRSVLEARVFEELPFRDIAEREGITEGNARVSYHLAVKALKSRLGAAGEEMLS